MVIIIPKANWVMDSMKPIIECPKCGGGLLGDLAPHGVHSDGTVHGSVVCPRDMCEFHANVKLDEWDGGEIPHS